MTLKRHLVVVLDDHAGCDAVPPGSRPLNVRLRAILAAIA
ncbi:MAG: hypothetical protein H6R02_1109 [Burkholderiaceae bacterium]|nr:hypothetical protein [Burkholderiaceae bacterium]